MRGSPRFQTILVLIVFALTALPVWRLTRPAGASASMPPIPTPPADITRGIALELEAIFAPLAADFQVTCLGQTVIEGRGPQSRHSARWTGSVPTEGVDLIVRAHWPGTTPATGPAAMRIIARFPDGHEVEKSFWAAADGTLQDVFTVPGAPASPAP